MMRRLNAVNMKYAVASIALLVALGNPWSVRAVESSMAAYMLLQIPGLVAAGYCAGKAMCGRYRSKGAGINAGGIAGLLMAIFVIAYWLLPRNVDAALNEVDVNLLKFVSLFVMAGIPLGRSWPHLHPIAKGIVWSNLISMLMVMSWLYTNAPIRLCNNFLALQQQLLGKSMFMVGLAVAVFIVLKAFVGKQVEET